MKIELSPSSDDHGHGSDQAIDSDMASLGSLNCKSLASDERKVCEEIGIHITCHAELVLEIFDGKDLKWKRCSIGEEGGQELGQKQPMRTKRQRERALTVRN